MSTMDIVPSQSRQPVRREPDQTPPGYEQVGSVVDEVSAVILRRPTPLWWWIGFSVSAVLMLIFIFVLLSLATRGVGLWGVQVPAVWAMDITNLIFWIGIGHAGTFISAFLLLMRQRWRTAFSRFAEAMTLFALATAGLFPIFHLGRPEWVFYITPYPNTMLLNTQWRSPLAWDFFAITAYFTVSLLFFYVDLLPDLASMRDKAKSGIARFLYGTAAMGWRGDATHWEGLHRASYVLAALATPLVISVHSIVGLDFAIATTPGWHHTIFPPFFVGGAIFSGLAMVLIFATILRSGFGYRKLITTEHLNKAAMLMLVTGLIVVYGYAVEFFGAWYTGKTHEWVLVASRVLGPYALPYWVMIVFNGVIIQALWFKSVRTSPTWLVCISICVLIGMWLERFIIVPASLAYPYIESMWNIFEFTGWDLLTLISPFGLFLTPLFLFLRFVPPFPLSETQTAAVEEAEAIS